MEWISVKDELPRFDENVLVYHEWIGQSKTYKEVEIAFVSSITTGADYKNVDWQTVSERRSIEPTHWMPLPEPPKQ